ncbi:MAG: peptidoglycan DD-metalloendopeptidase family protein [Betaproteobacteria bacterium]
MQTTVQKIIARFPERSLVIRSGSDTRYIVLKTWHQLSTVFMVGVFFIWTAVASVGFSWNHDARLAVESELAHTLAANQAFIEQLQNDQKNAYELRQAFNEEIRKNEEWAARFESIRRVSGSVLEQSSPETIVAFVPWFEDQLDLRIRSVEQSNTDLTELVMDMSNSVAEISGREAPQTLENVGSWLNSVADDLADAYETQSTAMEVLHDTMTLTLSKGFATIDGTPLADPEFAGFSPSFGTGGPSREVSDSEHVFEKFQDRSDRLMTLSQDLQALQALLDCAPLAPPVDYYNLTSKYGNRKDPFTKKPDWHEGVDLGAWPGTRVRATAPGVVTHAGYKGGFGRFVLIDHGCGIETAYGHLKKIYVKKGDNLDYRDTLGEVGSTGRSTGPHVHYEVRIKGKPVDPYQFIEAGRYVFKEQKLTVADAK